MECTDIHIAILDVAQQLPAWNCHSTTQVTESGWGTLPAGSKPAADNLSTLPGHTSISMPVPAERISAWVRVCGLCLRVPCRRRSPTTFRRNASLACCEYYRSKFGTRRDLSIHACPWMRVTGIGLIKVQHRSQSPQDASSSSASAEWSDNDENNGSRQ